MADVRLLGISGSIRKGSFNTMVLKTLRERLASAVELTLFDIGRLPHYKNAIDWGSRPAFRSVMKAKPMAFMTASMSAIGGARAQSQIREALLSTLAEVVNGPEVIITLSRKGSRRPSRRRSGAALRTRRRGAPHERHSAAIPGAGLTPRAASPVVRAW